LFMAYLGHSCQLTLVEVLEDGCMLEQIEVHGVKLRGLERRGNGRHRAERDMRSILLAAVSATLLAGPVAAQAFNPPSVQRAGPSRTRLGLLGFGMRAGVDPGGKGAAVLGVALDAGNVFVERLRLRPSVEIGILNGPNTYVGSFEGLYRLSDDHQSATPYFGAGLAVAGHAGCGADAGCPGLWINFVLGIEVRYRSTFNWLLEYHALNAFRRNRVYLGLTTRRGN
jgi:opacity protein-like surface antigen